MRYVGLCCYQDMLLALTEDGRLYRIWWDHQLEKVDRIQLVDKLPKELDYDI